MKHCLNNAKYHDDLRHMSKEELLRTFKNEVILKPHEKLLLDELAKYYAGILGLKVRLRFERSKGNRNRVRVLEDRLKSKEEQFKPYFDLMESLIDLEKRVREFRNKFDDLVYEGFGTTQLVTKEFLIKAITEVRYQRNVVLRKMADVILNSLSKLD